MALPPPEATSRRAIALAGSLAVLYALLCKILLFRDFEYSGSDLYSFLDMSRTWWTAGRLLYENAYGDHRAIHNYYLMPLFSPLTIPFGAYGLFVGVALLELAAVLRVATSTALDLAARLAVLAGLLSPLAFYAFDDPVWGFHVETCFVPLAALFALDLVERRFGRAALAAAAIVFVKEDGALVCAGVLVAFFARELWVARDGPREERRRILRSALAWLGLTALVFVAGLALLWSMGHGPSAPPSVGSGRIERALAILLRTVSGRGPAAHRAALADGLGLYGAFSALLLLPLGKRLAGGIGLVVVSVPCIAASLLVSAAHYKFALMLWPPRLAPLAALLVACVLLAAAGPAARRSRVSSASVAAGLVLVLVLVSWGLQVHLLGRSHYAIGRRLDAVALSKGDGYAISALSAREMDVYRCIADRLPMGAPVSPPPEADPLFHRQSIVFQGLGANAWRAPRVRAVPDSAPQPRPGSGFCSGPRIGSMRIEAECELLARIGSCG